MSTIWRDGELLIYCRFNGVKESQIEREISFRFNTNLFGGLIVFLDLERFCHRGRVVRM